VVTLNVDANVNQATLLANKYNITNWSSLSWSSV